MGHVAILGVFVADVTFRTDRLPKIGETLLGNSFALGPGGKGSNQAVAAARAGADTRFIARLGRDTFGEMAVKLWEDAGVRPHVAWVEEATGSAAILVEEGSGNNAIIIAPGAAGRIAPEDVRAEADVIAGASVFVTQLEQPVGAALEALRIARGGGAVTVLNPAPAAEIPAEMVALADYVTPNESEAEGLTGVHVGSVADAERAARALCAMGAGAAIITLGENGSFVFDGDVGVHVPAITAGPVVETTGAGDAYNGGFAAALAEGADLAGAVRFATATAALSVTRPGAAASMPARAEIEALLAGSPLG